jgi:hypothetical protein
MFVPERQLQQASNLKEDVAKDIYIYIYIKPTAYLTKKVSPL